MGSFGKVQVKDNRYRFQGDFHVISRNAPIRNENDGWKLLGVTKPRDMTYVHSYGGEAPFFESLSQGKLLATRCDNPKCETKGSVYMPFRIHCPECLGRNTTIDLTEVAKKSATVHTFMICERTGAFNTLQAPIKFINIEFAGVCTILMSYLSIGDPDIGMKVVPIFRKKDPTYTITDLSWVPVGTPPAMLPEGFSF